VKLIALLLHNRYFIFPLYLYQIILLIASIAIQGNLSNWIYAMSNCIVPAIWRLRIEGIRTNIFLVIPCYILEIKMIESVQWLKI